jgi:aspartyl/asparaginyl beta-hydroxylase (cupin superfamily)/Flp pilus assembly protein TadD
MIEGDDRRIRELVTMAAQSLAGGRAQDAGQLLRQAEAEAPRHPLVLNEIGKRKLLAGDPAGAFQVLDQAMKAAPEEPALWLNFAAALRGLNRADEELATLNKVLLAEPTNMRALLQVASLHELRGDGRTAAATYRKALQMIPPGAQLTAEMRPVLDHAKSVVDADRAALETFIEDRIAALRARHANQSLSRFDKSLATLLRKRRVYRPQPTFIYVPELPAIEFFPREDFPWLDQIEAAADDIRDELIEVLADGPSALEPYVSVDATPDEKWRALNKSRRWGVFFLWKAGEAITRNMARCPKTVKALSAWPKCELPGSAPTAVFSILEPRTRIPPHTGVNNARLICHLPLIIPPGCGFRVGAETRAWEPGKAFVFDDTIEHEAWNDSDQARAVLIFDVWNPYTTEAEREMVSAVTTSVEQFYGELPPYL